MKTHNKTPKDPNSNRSKRIAEFKEKGSLQMAQERFIKRAMSVGFSKEQSEFLANKQLN